MIMMVCDIESVMSDNEGVNDNERVMMFNKRVQNDNFSEGVSTNKSIVIMKLQLTMIMKIMSKL